MKLAIVANESLKQELIAGAIGQQCEIGWVSSSAELSQHPDTDAVLDFLFEQNGYNPDHLKVFLPRPVIVSSVIKTIDEIGSPFVRVNGWPTFNNGKIAELSAGADTDKKVVDKIFAAINRKTEWVPDVAGFISARVVSMVINEAYFALEENISSKEDIDIAMKLGTNYPYGPFEWAKKIGLKNIKALLSRLAEKEIRYQPAALLIKAAAEE